MKCKSSSLFRRSGICLLVLGMCGIRASAQVINISSGYYDLSPSASGGGPPLPDPWINSANTTFYGSTGDLSLAVASDPDISALLIQNTGPNAASLSALSLSSGMDVLARARTPNGNLPAGDIMLTPGQNYIFAVGDGSDEGLSNQTIGLTISGINYSFPDARTAQAPDGVIFGDVPQLGGGDETQPWTLDGTIPEPAGMSLLSIAILLVFRRRRINVGGHLARAGL